MDRYLDKELEKGCTMFGYEGWLFIAWAFRIEDVFTTLSLDIIKRSYIGANGDLFMAEESGPVLNSPYLPGVIVSKFSQILL